MIDFSVRVFAFSSSNCINFCPHTCMLLALCSVFGLDHVSPLMITECVTLEVERDLFFFSMSWSPDCRQSTCSSRLTRKERRAEYTSSFWTRPLSLYSLLHFGRQLRSFVSVDSMTLSILLCIVSVPFRSSVLNAVSVSLFLWQRYTFDVQHLTILILNLVSSLIVVFSIPVTWTWCSISVILVNVEFLFRRVLYRHIDFRETNIELPKCSSVDWNRHAPQLRTIYGVHWFSWVKIEMSIRRVKSTRRVMMRLRRQNHKTKIRRT